MRRSTVILICLIFAAGAIVCGDVFAQRGIDNAQEAAKAAKASLTTRPHSSSSQIEWLDQFIDVVNMEKPATKGTSTLKNKTRKAE